MKRLRIRGLAFIAAFATALTFCLSVYAKIDVPNPTDKFFVNDYANIIDSETEEYIFQTGKAYNNGGGAQVAVLTVNSIGNASLEDFAIETARKWGLGDKDKDNGVLILIVMFLTIRPHVLPRDLITCAYYTIHLIL